MLNISNSYLQSGVVGLVPAEEDGEPVGQRLGVLELGNG